MLAALLCFGVPALPHGASATPAANKPPTSRDLPRLTAELAAVTAHAQQLSDLLDEAAARDGGLRLAYSQLEDARYAAQSALDSRARQVYMASAPVPVGNWAADFAAPELQELARRGERAALTVDQGLVDAVTARVQQMKALQRQADAFRARLLVQARAVFADQDRARELLAQAQAVAAAEHAAAVLRQLASTQSLLDGVSEQVTLALTPAQTVRSKDALAREAPVIALLEASGSGIPAGYARSGQVTSGTASWYGPGFVGNPTASGAPYDPERLTCANKELPLGTVIHVWANGLQVNCLVNDRGPYVGDRILDMSRAGARALGYSGLAQVTFEVLVPS
ncbi:MAG: rare lipoprotein [Frankiales bacterium]|nr:rare lipoprotein [Frankiales bacterium]